MSNFEQIFSNPNEYKNTVYITNTFFLIVAPSLYSIKH